MENENKEREYIQNCYEALKLDERASQKEVELAYEVLTKNCLIEDLKFYRVAFEYLMNKVYGYKGERILTKTKKNSDNSIITSSCEIINDTPENENISFYGAYVENDVFLNCLKKGVKKFFNFNFYTINDIYKALNMAEVGEYLYDKIFFDISLNKAPIITSNFKREQQDLIDFVENLKKFYFTNANNLLCAEFKISKTELGVSGMITIETSAGQALIKNLEAKARFLRRDLHITVN